jgi:hypothetical protein
MPVLTRKLLGYRWELDNKRTTLIDEKNNTSITLDKVRLMSFMKFAVNVLDKMRIEEIKQLKMKNRLKKVTGKKSVLRVGADVKSLGEQMEITNLEIFLEDNYGRKVVKNEENG